MGTWYRHDNKCNTFLWIRYKAGYSSFADLSRMCAWSVAFSLKHTPVNRSLEHWGTGAFPVFSWVLSQQKQRKAFKTDKIKWDSSPELFLSWALSQIWSKILPFLKDSCIDKEVS